MDETRPVSGRPTRAGGGASPDLALARPEPRAEGRRLKILLVSFHFPPVNTIAAVRIGKMARYLHGRGHAVRVLTARRDSSSRSLPVEVPSEFVTCAEWLDVDRIIHPLSRRTRAAGTAAEPPPASRQAAAPPLRRLPSALRALRAGAGSLYNNLLLFPDEFGGWIPSVLARGAEILKRFDADLIYASGPPFSAFVGAALLSRRTGVPWAAEYRDRWSDYPYTPRPRWRSRIDERLEHRVLRGAAAVVTVSAPWADIYRARYGKPTAVVYNGFDPSDFPASEPTPTIDRRAPVSIVHMGALYAGRRDPSPLFAAIARSRLTPGDVRVLFYGTEANQVEPLARRFGVADFVEARPPVPYGTALALQRSSDVLLLLQWDDPDDKGNIPGKFFEYMGARRPILGIGLEDGFPAQMVRARKAGLYSNDPARIEAQLELWVAERRRHGTVTGLPPAASQDLSRDDQYRLLEAFLLATFDPSGAPSVARAEPAGECSAALEPKGSGPA